MSGSMVSIEKIKQKDIAALSRAITLNESTIIENNLLVDELLRDATRSENKSIIISISGIPGVGKSSFIEVFGTYLHRLGFSIAVFSIDPSSELSHGSILGDKSRMTELSRLKNVFIRPSPNSNKLGGIGINTYKNIEIAKLAGFDIILIETVGVGQSETLVKQLSDIFILLQMPSSGDELQGIKKGIMEMADFFIIHKADGDLKIAAEKSKKEIESALHLTRDEDMTGRIFTFSSIDKIGLELIWTSVFTFFESQKEKGEVALTRKNQEKYWAEESFFQLLQKHYAHKFKGELKVLLDKIDNGVFVGASDMLSIFSKSNGPNG
jgi:LAO/AO transport system kinase